MDPDPIQIEPKSWIRINSMYLDPQHCSLLSLKGYRDQISLSSLKGMIWSHLTSHDAGGEENL